MRVFLARSAEAEGPVQAWRQLASQDRIGAHSACETPEEADLVLFVDLHMQADMTLGAVRGHALWRDFGDKILAYDERDLPLCALPGLCTSMPASRLDARFFRACPYYITRQTLDDPDPESGERDLLFSFVGARSHPVRDGIVALSHARGVCEWSGVSFFDFSGREDVVQRQDQQRLRYRELLGRSKFVLCPRGAGLSSIRLFEVMASGRVPVVVADGWAEPPGPDWESCIVRVPESDIARIPRILERREGEWPAVARAARAAWLEWFAPDVVFHHMIESASQILESQPRRHFRLSRREVWAARRTQAATQARVSLGAVRRRLLHR